MASTSRAARRGRFAAAGLLVSCAVVCSLPFLLGAGAVASLWAALSGASGAASGVAVGVGAVAVGWYVRRRRPGAVVSEDAATCGCGGACG
jgi:hypothetical protein